MSNHHHRCTLARLRPELAAVHPSIPSRTWYPVLTRNPFALSPQAEPGLVWVKVEGRRRKLPAAYFKFARPCKNLAVHAVCEAGSGSAKSSYPKRTPGSSSVYVWLSTET